MAAVDTPEFERWQEQSASTARAARLVGDGGHPEWACFLAEQAAQLAVKGLLHGIGAEAWGHDLTVLARRAAAALGAAWPGQVDDQAARLARHYIPARYPDAHPGGSPLAHYRPSDAEAAIADCDAIRGAVQGAWRALVEPDG